MNISTNESNIACNLSKIDTNESNSLSRSEAVSAP